MSLPAFFALRKSQIASWPDDDCTPWQPGSTHPHAAGVYQRKIGIDICWSRWDGVQWLVACSCYGSALRATGRSSFQDTPWRGLTRTASLAAIKTLTHQKAKP